MVVVDGGQVGVVEDRRQPLEAAATAQAQTALAIQLPAALPLLLVLVAGWVAESRLGFDVVEVHVLGAGSVGPGLLAGDRAGVTADALVEVHDHAHLGHDPHWAAPFD